MTLCAIAAEAARGGAAVLYINLESEDVELHARIASNLLNMPNGRFHKQEPEEMLRAGERLSKYTFSVRDLIDSSKPSDIRRAVEDFKAGIGRYPDVICVDYLNEAEPEKDSNGRVTSYKVMGDNLKELQKIAKRINCVVIVYRVEVPC